jgi:hypothetical protein
MSGRRPGYVQRHGTAARRKRYDDETGELAGNRQQIILTRPFWMRFPAHRNNVVERAVISSGFA